MGVDNSDLNTNADGKEFVSDIAGRTEMLGIVQPEGPESSAAKVVTGAEVPQGQLNLAFNATSENVAAFSDYLNSRGLSYDIYHEEGKAENGFIVLKSGWSQQTKDGLFAVAQGLDTSWGWPITIRPEANYVCLQETAGNSGDAEKTDYQEGDLVSLSNEKLASLAKTGADMTPFQQPGRVSTVREGAGPMSVEFGGRVIQVSKTEVTRQY